ncbi:hypothetical protein ABT337_31690 [Saccharopolyspora hirsuta]|nr:hypothetical protein [Saccharopolyspora hirsuta]
MASDCRTCSEKSAEVTSPLSSEAYWPAMKTSPVEVSATWL